MVVGYRGSGQWGRIGLVMTVCALACGARCAGQEVPAAETVPLSVEALQAATVGASWVILQWQSPAQRFDVLWGESGRGGRAPHRWETVSDIYTPTYSVIGLKPDTAYHFRIRAYPLAEAPGPPVLSEPIAARTSADVPREWHGLHVWPQRQLPTALDGITEPAIETDGTYLYTLEGVACKLILSCLDRTTLAVLWSLDFSPDIDDVAPCCRRPDLCFSQGKLWLTWQADRAGGELSEPAVHRQRLAYYDLAGEYDRVPPGSAERFSAVLEIVPSGDDMGTCWGSLAWYQDALWACWTELWRGESGAEDGRVCVAPYDPRTGALGKRAEWTDCPTTFPAETTLGSFGPGLRVLLSDRAGLLEAPETEPLLSARFDGRRFYDVTTVRRLGRSFSPRGVQTGDRFYFVYQTDAAYPASGGLYCDIDLGRWAVGGLRVDPKGSVFVGGITCVGDMKLNAAPDIAAVGDDLYVVCGKRDHQPDPQRGWEARPVRGYGTFVTRISGALQSEGF